MMVKYCTVNKRTAIDFDSTIFGNRLTFAQQIRVVVNLVGWGIQ